MDIDYVKIKQKITENIMNTEKLFDLISQGGKLINTIGYLSAGNGVIRTFSVYKTSEKSEYHNWQSSV